MHYYGDVSNLNAPYDATTLQGVDTPQPVGGLGAKLMNVTPMQQRQYTAAHQRDINVRLVARGLCPIKADGIWGKESCGALRYLVPSERNMHSECTKFRPYISPKSCATQKRLADGEGYGKGPTGRPYIWGSRPAQQVKRRNPEAYYPSPTPTLAQWQGAWTKAKCKNSCLADHRRMRAGSSWPSLSDRDANIWCGEACGGNWGGRGPLKGLEGFSGFGSVTWDGKTLPSLGYPWRQASNDTLQVQARFNTELAKRDRCPLLLDGDLGPRVCGALFEMSDVSAPDGLVATCSQHAGESTPTEFCPGGVVSDSPLISPPSDSEDPDSSTASDKKGGFPMLAAVGIVGGLVLLAAVMKKKKR